jgi:hypothetical protein
MILFYLKRINIKPDWPIFPTEYDNLVPENLKEERCVSTFIFLHYISFKILFDFLTLETFVRIFESRFNLSSL